MKIGYYISYAFVVKLNRVFKEKIPMSLIQSTLFASPSHEHFTQERILEVELDRIRVNPDQPRRIFAEEDLAELAESIKSVGLIHPPLVRAVQGGEFFEIISGERRFRASRLAGLEKIPVVVKWTDQCLSAQAALIENVQRVDLNPLEIALALNSLMQKFGFTQEHLAQQIGKKRSTVANYLRLLSLPQVVQESVARGEISMGHAKVILSVASTQKQLTLHEMILADDLSVRQTEEAALKLQSRPKDLTLPFRQRDIHLQELERQLQILLGTKVVISGSSRKGRITIDYYNLEDLNRLIELLKIEL
jgi:ParB family chromosome partitioning protein